MSVRLAEDQGEGEAGDRNVKMADMAERIKGAEWENAGEGEEESG